MHGFQLDIPLADYVKTQHCSIFDDEVVRIAIHFLQLTRHLFVVHFALPS